MLEEQLGHTAFLRSSAFVFILSFTVTLLAPRRQFPTPRAQWSSWHLAAAQLVFAHTW